MPTTPLQTLRRGRLAFFSSICTPASRGLVTPASRGSISELSPHVERGKLAMPATASEAEADKPSSPRGREADKKKPAAASRARL